ncbi:hypothetical protein [Peribacillus frigoritolerans]|uniref:hypothetical protein n=1 Tax=Peribacillus castrilensis TaxID=2897690 RepID=UPI002DC54D88|nr:hypothetical protein [Peribacillus castrilensis]
MINKIKSLYSHFVIVFLVLFLGSSGYVDPRSWWSLYNVKILDNSTFIAQMSWEKVMIYALITLILVAILNQPSVKKIIKTILKIGVMKLQLLFKTIKTLVN